MMGAVRGWLLAVIAVSLLCAVADALMPFWKLYRPDLDCQSLQE